MACGLDGEESVEDAIAGAAMLGATVGFPEEFKLLWTLF
jgi:hypothetical protein